MAARNAISLCMLTLAASTQSSLFAAAVPWASGSLVGAGALAKLDAKVLTLEGNGSSSAGWVSRPRAVPRSKNIEVTWEHRATRENALFAQVEALDARGKRTGAYGDCFNACATERWGKGRLIVTLPTEAIAFRVFIGNWRRSGRAQVKNLEFHALTDLASASVKRKHTPIFPKYGHGQTFLPRGDKIDLAVFRVERENVDTTESGKLTCHVREGGFTGQVLAEASVDAAGLPLCAAVDCVFEFPTVRLTPGKTYSLTLEANEGQTYYGHIVAYGLDNYPGGRMKRGRQTFDAYDLWFRAYRRDEWDFPLTKASPSSPGSTASAGGQVGAPYSTLSAATRNRIEQILQPPPLARRDPFYGTPSYSFGELSPAEMAELGLTHILYLMYWFHWETAPGKWHDEYVERIEKAMADRARLGIRALVRVGDGRPGARIWKMSRGKPAKARNHAVYPDEADTDARYFAYLGRLANRLRGKVHSYTLDDELDSRFGSRRRGDYVSPLLGVGLRARRSEDAL